MHNRVKICAAILIAAVVLAVVLVITFSQDRSNENSTVTDNSVLVVGSWFL